MLNPDGFGEEKCKVVTHAPQVLTGEDSNETRSRHLAMAMTVFGSSTDSQTWAP
jgi:hypothetical protein